MRLESARFTENAGRGVHAASRPGVEALAEPAAAWPPSLTYGELSSCREEKYCVALDACRDLYEGGPRFKENIEKYLDKTQIEKQGSSGPARRQLDQEDVNAGQDAWAASAALGAEHWRQRKASTRYTNHVAGMLDHVVASVLKYRPRIEGPGDYWRGLNENIDGFGSDFISFLRKLAIEILITGRPFVAIRGKEFPVPPANLAEFEAMGGGEMRLSIIRREEVTDWTQSDGLYSMLRRYTRDAIRPNAYAAPDKDRHLWTFFVHGEISEYELVWETKRGDIPKETAVLRKGEPRKHSFDGLPLEPATVMDGLHAMGRLMDPALKLFNQEANIEWCNSRHGSPTLVIKTNRQDLGSLVMSGMTALVLETTDTVEYLVADKLKFEALFTQREQLKRDLYEVFASMAQHAAVHAVQNARQSAQAKDMDREPFTLLLQTVADGLKDGVLKSLRKIAKLRGESPEKITITGLDLSDFTPEDGEDLDAALKPDGASAKASETQVAA